jgi:signal transduction histidine kinase
MKNSIRYRLLIAFFGLAICPLLLVGAIVGMQSYTTLKNSTIRMQDEMGKAVLNKFVSFFDEIQNELILTGKLNMLLKGYENLQFDTMGLLMSKNTYEELTLFDDKGNVRMYFSRLGLSSPDRSGGSVTEEFAQAMKTAETRYSPVWFDKASGEPLISIAVPLIDLRSGEKNCILSARVRLKKIWDLISDVRVNPGQSIYIVDDKGKLIAHRNPSLVLKGVQFHILEGKDIYQGITGETSIISVQKARFGGQEFNVIAEQNVSNAFALAINTVRIISALIVVALLAAGALGLMIVRQIIRPIRDMALTAQAASAGDLSQRVEVKRNDELGMLGAAFNSMTSQVKNLIDGLEQKIAERTEQLKNAQAELLRQERLATLGKVTATIAHEIRNPLATVNTSVFSIGAALENNQPERIKRAISLAERNIRRCDNIITELLDFTRKLEIRPAAVDIDSWIERTLDEQVFPEGIILKKDLHCGLKVPLDAEHMRRAVVNIITNAVHALSEENSPGKELTIKTSDSGKHLEIHVADNGPGMSAEVQNKMFEPLFSTKGFGVGLGLSITKDIIEKHNGQIEVQSKPGEGTTVTIRIPLEGMPA